MATSPLPLNEKPYYNTDAIANSIAADDMFDCYLEPVPGVGYVTRRRPGLKVFANLSTDRPGDGLFWWDAAGKLIAVSGGHIFDVSRDGIETDITGVALEQGIPVTFADGQDVSSAPWLYLANGKLIYTTGGNTIYPRYIGQVSVAANSVGLGLQNGGSWAITANHGPDVALAYIITFTNNNPNDYSALGATVTGTDILGAALVETVTLPLSHGTTRTTNYFKTITSVVPSATIGNPASVSFFLTGATGATWTLTATTPTDGLMHQVTIKNNSATDHSAKTVLITGINSDGITVTDNIKLPGANLTVTTTQYFTKLVTVVPSATIGADTMEIGYAAVASMGVGWGDLAAEYTSSNVPAATHVAFVKGSFIANEKGTARFDFTDTNPITNLPDNTFWGSVDNPLSCDAKGDTLLTLVTAWQEINAWGSQGLEVWQYDGSTPFSPVAGAFAECGIEAPYSVVVANNTIFALCTISGTRTVVKLQGRAPVACSEAIGRVLADMLVVSDAIGDLISVGGVAIYLLSFPTEGQSWAYDYKNDVWTRWGYWQEGEHQRFLGQHATFAKAWNKHLIMSRVDGKIYELDRAVYTDDSNEMVSFRRTGWINNGTYNRKICDQFYIKVKRGEGDVGTLLVRWRDDGRLEWSNWFEVSLSPVGDRDFVSKNNRFGMYRSRQYEFRISGDADLVLVGVDTEMRGLSS